LLFFLGFFILVRGARFLVDGAVSISKTLGLSSWVIGVLVVGIGTSIPEFSINIVSALKETDIGVGTLLGSNTFNILFILGLSALISPALIRKEWVVKDFVLNLCAILVSVLFLVLPIFGDTSYVGITTQEAYFIFSLFIVWILYMLFRKPSYSAEEEESSKHFKLWASLLMIAGGFLGVFFGAQWVVSGAEHFALFLGISAHIVGLSVIAIGTSLPEISVSLVAAYKGRTDIAVGNIIGSNIFDFIGIIGTAGLISQIPFDYNLLLDTVMTLIAGIFLISSMYIGKKYTLTRSTGIVFVLTYCVYFVTIIVRAPF